MITTAVAVTFALLSFLVGCVWVFVSADLFVRYFYEARMVALTHLFTLGWVSLMIVGVLRQLAPVAFGLKLRRPNLIGIGVVLWIAGVIAMIAGFATLAYVVAAIGTTLLLVAVITIVTVLLFGFGGVRRDTAHSHLLSALLYFVAAASIGAWMGLAKGFDLPLPTVFHRVLFAHIYLAGAGWAGMMILAVLSRLFPQPHLRQPLQSKIRFAAFHTGLIGLSTGLLTTGDWYGFFGAILAVACMWYAISFIPVLREFAQPSDRSTYFLVSSFGCLLLVAIIGLWMSLMPAVRTVVGIQLQFVYGFVYMFGWLSLMILGMLYRIIPTHISKLLSARGTAAPATMRRAFVDPRLQVAVLILLLLGLAVSSAGILRQDVNLFRLGWGTWTAGIGGFVAGLARLGIAVRRILSTGMRS